MDKRNFIKTAAGITASITTLAVLPAESSVMTRKTHHSKKMDSLERRRNSFPNVPLITHDGKAVNFYEDLIKDKIVLINFMYSRCGDVCPGMTANLKLVHKELGNRVGKDIFMYSITLEPGHDTPAVLKAYTELFNIQQGWTFLSGKKTDIELLRKHLGFSFSDPALDKDNTQHIGVVKFGIEPLERWGMSPALGDPKYIAEYLRWMEPSGKRPNLKELQG